MTASNSYSITNEIIITAMDRFVWFVLLVVFSHLVTEFTRVTGYARGARNDLPIVNDTLIMPKLVQNLLLYPEQDYLGVYDALPSKQNTNEIVINKNNYGNNPTGMTESISGNTEQSFFFSFRPLIDSIFEIPISTLRAVNNLVAQLTGNYQHTASPKSSEALSLLSPSTVSDGGNGLNEAGLRTTKTEKRVIMREESV